MVVREIKQDLEGVLANFDWFNDYKDTVQWCKHSFPEAVPRLDEGYDKWFAEDIKRHKSLAESKES